MNLNSQFSYTPAQPDNPEDSVRHDLLRYALTAKGWPEDAERILHLMSPPPAVTNYAVPGECRGLRVGIIGGGLAGLAAAYELRKLGFDITLYDALEDRIGGRVYTYYFNRQKGLYHEFGAMRIPVSHETVWHYLNLFRLPTRPFIQYNPNAYVFLKNVRVRNDPGGVNVMRDIYPKYRLREWERTVPWQKLFSAGIESALLAATGAERAEILQVKSDYSREALRWSDSSNLTIMQAAGLSEGAISLVSNFQPLLSGNLYHSYIDYVQEDYPANLTFLYEIKGGMARLPAAFFSALTRENPYAGIADECVGNFRYRGGCWVDGISLIDGGGGVRLKYRRAGSNRVREEPFDYCVCAIPFSTLRTMDIDPLFSDIKMRAIREVYYTPSQKTLLLCRERFWERDGIVGGGSFTDLPVASVWYPSDHARLLRDPENFVEDFKNLPWKEPGALIGSYNFALDTTRLTNQPEERVFAEIRKELALVHGLPPRDVDRVTEEMKTINWDEQPSIRGALSFFSPQQKKLFAYGMSLPEYGGRVVFAGEHISAVHRWMQGALQSGMQAANDLVKACRGNRGST